MLAFRCSYIFTFPRLAVARQRLRYKLHASIVRFWPSKCALRESPYAGYWRDKPGQLRNPSLGNSRGDKMPASLFSAEFQAILDSVRDSGSGQTPLTPSPED